MADFNIFANFPNCDQHTLNLDWIIEICKNAEDALGNSSGWESRIAEVEASEAGQNQKIALLERDSAEHGSRLTAVEAFEPAVREKITTIENNADSLDARVGTVEGDVQSHGSLIAENSRLIANNSKEITNIKKASAKVVDFGTTNVVTSGDTAGSQNIPFSFATAFSGINENDVVDIIIQIDGRTERLNVVTLSKQAGSTYAATLAIKASYNPGGVAFIPIGVIFEDTGLGNIRVGWSLAI